MRIYPYFGLPSSALGVRGLIMGLYGAWGWSLTSVYPLQCGGLSLSYPGIIKWFWISGGTIALSFRLGCIRGNPTFGRFELPFIGRTDRVLHRSPFPSRVKSLARPQQLYLISMGAMLEAFARPYLLSQRCRGCGYVSLQPTSNSDY